MRVLLRDESRGDIEPMVGLAMQVRALGAPLVTTGVMPTGVWL